MNIILFEHANITQTAKFEMSQKIKSYPISFSVVGPRNIVKVFGKENRAAALRFKIPLGKTYAALPVGHSSSRSSAQDNERPVFTKVIDDVS